jgi:hypothetical protein
MRPARWTKCTVHFERADLFLTEAIFSTPMRAAFTN